MLSKCDFTDLSDLVAISFRLFTPRCKSNLCFKTPEKKCFCFAKKALFQKKNIKNWTKLFFTSQICVIVKEFFSKTAFSKKDGNVFYFLPTFLTVCSKIFYSKKEKQCPWKKNTCHQFNPTSHSQRSENLVFPNMMYWNKEYSCVWAS